MEFTGTIPRNVTLPTLSTHMTSPHPSMLKNKRLVQPPVSASFMEVAWYAPHVTALLAQGAQKETLNTFAGFKASL